MAQTPRLVDGEGWKETALSAQLSRDASSLLARDPQQDEDRKSPLGSRSFYTSLQSLGCRIACGWERTALSSCGQDGSCHPSALL